MSVKKLLLTATATIFLGCFPALAEWEILKESNDNGEKLVIAEKFGDGGIVFSLVCLHSRASVEMIIPDTDSLEEVGISFLFGVDGREPLRIGGYTFRAQPDVLVFNGVDLKDRPAQATNKLIKQIRHGNKLNLVAKSDQSDEFFSIEEWSLKGSSKTIDQMYSDCE